MTKITRIVATVSVLALSHLLCATAAIAEAGEHAAIAAALRDAQEQQLQGRYGQARATAERALLGAESAPLRLQAKLRIVSAQANLALGDFGQAEQELKVALAQSRKAESPASEAAALLLRATLHSSRRAFAEAIADLEDASAVAASAGLAELGSRAHANAARIAVSQGAGAEQVDRHARAARKILKEKPEMSGAESLRLSLAITDVQMLDRAPDPVRLERVFTDLSRFRSEAEAAGDSAILATSQGLIGRLYEQAGRDSEALTLTQRAMEATTPESSPAERLRLLWQEGRLLRKRGRRAEARIALTKAVDAALEMRAGVGSAHRQLGSTFRQSVGPVFYELADLLLDAPEGEGSDARQNRLRRARDLIERLRAEELRDYFRDECVEALQKKVRPLEKVRGALVLYPVSLEDRLVLLVSKQGAMQEISLPIPAERIDRESRALRRLAQRRTTNEYREPGRLLYQWIVEPIEEMIGNDTLVIVPQGSMLGIPYAALFDGSAHLIERFPFAVSPGLELTDPVPMEKEDARLLLAGVSKSVQGFEELPNVPAELSAIGEQFSASVLLDEEFTADALQQALANPKVSVLHIASHGEVRAAAEESFLLTWNGRLTFDQLSNMIQGFRFREVPLELLVLSACETAAGDDRAALGLAGAAVKSGARSAIGSLWRVPDRATELLMTEFYRALSNSGVSKAVALQSAQLAVLRAEGLRHPANWSSFLLISNWL